MCKTARRTHGTAARSVPVADLLASEARRDRARGHVRARQSRVRRPLSMPFPGRSIERVLRDFGNSLKLFYYFMFVLYKFGYDITGFWLFPSVSEGLGSSRRLAGTISTYPGTYTCPWSRVTAKNPRVSYTEYGMKALLQNRTNTYNNHVTAC